MPLEQILKLQEMLHLFKIDSQDIIDHQEDDEVNHHLNNKDDIHKENDPKHQKKRHQ